MYTFQYPFHLFFHYLNLFAFMIPSADSDELYMIMIEVTTDIKNTHMTNWSDAFDK